MRLICPNCGAQYEVDDAVIPDAGRDVQCSNCGHTWFQQPAHLDADLAEELGEDFDPPEEPDNEEPLQRQELDPGIADILREEHANGAYSCVMHCFSSSAELAKAALDLDFYLSMSGIAAFPKSAELRGIFAAAPLERILVETDSPYLAPPPHRGKRNEPAFTAHTARKGAETMGVDYETFARATQENFDRLFWKAAEWRAAA